MKIKVKKNIKTLSILFSIILVGIFIYLNYKAKQPFDINSLNLSGWTKFENGYNFWFPKDEITVVKDFKNSYYIEHNVGFDSPLKQENIDMITNYNKFSNLFTQLKKQHFKKRDDLSGLFQQEDSDIAYHYSTYQKENTFCQLSLLFECWKGRCTLDPPAFGCGKFNFDNDYQSQKTYYQLLKKFDIDLNEYMSAIHNVSINNNGNTQIKSSARLDGGQTFFDSQNNIICDGKPCCDNSSRGVPEIYGDWCTDDYQTLETYQPVGL